MKLLNLYNHILKSSFKFVFFSVNSLCCVRDLRPLSQFSPPQVIYKVHSSLCCICSINNEYSHIWTKTWIFNVNPCSVCSTSSPHASRCSWFWTQWDSPHWNENHADSASRDHRCKWGFKQTIGRDCEHIPGIILLRSNHSSIFYQKILFYLIWCEATRYVPFQLLLSAGE